MPLRIAHCTLESKAPYSQSRAHETPKLEKENGDQYEGRTWREKCITDANGQIVIPAMALKMTLDSAAKMLQITIPSKGKATYTKFFVSGVLVLEDIPLGIHKDDVPMDRIFANSDGIRGSGKRVWRQFPRIDSYKVVVPYHVLADEITKEVFEASLKQAGMYVGLGRFRPQNGGLYGRFNVAGIKWETVA